MANKIYKGLDQTYKNYEYNKQKESLQFHSYSKRNIINLIGNQDNEVSTNGVSLPIKERKVNIQKKK